MSKFNLRAGQPEDIDEILSLIRQLAKYEKLEHEAVATPEGLAKTLFGPRAYAETLVAEAEGQVIGFALFFHNYSTFLAKPGIYLEDLFVAPKYRGKGIGKALLEALIGLARERDCGRVEWSVLDWNQPAIDFYESMGAKAQDEWTVYRVTL